MNKVTQIFAVVAENPDEEGIVGHRTPKGWMPLVFATDRNLDKVRDIARTLANDTGKTLRIVRFTEREDLEVFRPGSGTGVLIPVEFKH